MKALLTTWRSYVLAVIAMAGIALVFSETTEDENFLLNFLWSKALGVACLYVCYKLSNYWERRNKIDYSTLSNIDDAWE